MGRWVRQATTLPRGRVTAGSTLGPGALDQQESALSLDQRGFPEGSELEQRPDGWEGIIEARRRGLKCFQREDTHTKAWVLRREGLQRQPGAKGHRSCATWQREVALKAGMRDDSIRLLRLWLGERTSVQVQAGQQGNRNARESSGGAAQGTTGGLVSRRLTRSPCACTQMISPGRGEVEGEEGSAWALDF